MLSDTHTHAHTHTRSVELQLLRDRPVAATSSWQLTLITRQTSLPPAGFVPAVPARERPQTHACVNSLPLTLYTTPRGSLDGLWAGNLLSCVWLLITGLYSGNKLWHKNTEISPLSVWNCIRTHSPAVGSGPVGWMRLVRILFVCQYYVVSMEVKRKTNTRSRKG
jgi:hypothetical protein